MTNMNWWYNIGTYLDSSDDIDDDEYQCEINYVLNRLYSTKSIPMPEYEVIL